MCTEEDEVFIFDNKGDQVTSVAMTRKTFCEVWAILEKIEFNLVENKKALTAKDLAKIRAGGIIPMILRTEATKPIFERFNVITNKLTGALKDDDAWVPKGEE